MRAGRQLQRILDSPPERSRSVAPVSSRGDFGLQSEELDLKNGTPTTAQSLLEERAGSDKYPMPGMAPLASHPDNFQHLPYSFQEEGARKLSGRLFDMIAGTNPGSGMGMHSQETATVLDTDWAPGIVRVLTEMFEAKRDHTFTPLRGLGEGLQYGFALFMEDVESQHPFTRETDSAILEQAGIDPESFENAHDWILVSTQFPIDGSPDDSYGEQEVYHEQGDNAITDGKQIGEYSREEAVIRKFLLSQLAARDSIAHTEKMSAEKIKEQNKITDEAIMAFGIMHAKVLKAANERKLNNGIDFKDIYSQTLNGDWDDVTTSDAYEESIRSKTPRHVSQKTRELIEYWYYQTGGDLEIIGRLCRASFLMGALSKHERSLKKHEPSQQVADSFDASRDQIRKEAIEAVNMPLHARLMRKNIQFRLDPVTGEQRPINPIRLSVSGRDEFDLQWAQAVAIITKGDLKDSAQALHSKYVEQIPLPMQKKLIYVAEPDVGNGLITTDFCSQSQQEGRWLYFGQPSFYHAPKGAYPDEIYQATFSDNMPLAPGLVAEFNVVGPGIVDANDHRKPSVRRFRLYNLLQASGKILDASIEAGGMSGVRGGLLKQRYLSDILAKDSKYRRFPTAKIFGDEIEIAASPREGQGVWVHRSKDASTLEVRTRKVVSALKARKIEYLLRKSAVQDYNKNRKKGEQAQKLPSKPKIKMSERVALLNKRVILKSADITSAHKLVGAYALSNHTVHFGSTMTEPTQQDQVTTQIMRSHGRTRNHNRVRVNKVNVS